MPNNEHDIPIPAGGNTATQVMMCREAFVALTASSREKMPAELAGLLVGTDQTLEDGVRRVIVQAVVPVDLVPAGLGYILDPEALHAFSGRQRDKSRTNTSIVGWFYCDSGIALFPPRVDFDEIQQMLPQGSHLFLLVNPVSEEGAFYSWNSSGYAAASFDEVLPDQEAERIIPWTGEVPGGLEWLRTSTAYVPTVQEDGDLPGLELWERIATEPLVPEHESSESDLQSPIPAEHVPGREDAGFGIPVESQIEEEPPESQARAHIQTRAVNVQPPGQPPAYPGTAPVGRTRESMAAPGSAEADEDEHLASEPASSIWSATHFTGGQEEFNQSVDRIDQAVNALGEDDGQEPAKSASSTAQVEQHTRGSKRFTAAGRGLGGKFTPGPRIQMVLSSVLRGSYRAARRIRGYEPSEKLVAGTVLIIWEVLGFVLLALFLGRVLAAPIAGSRAPSATPSPVPGVVVPGSKTPSPSPTGSPLGQPNTLTFPSRWPLRQLTINTIESLEVE